MPSVSRPTTAQRVFIKGTEIRDLKVALKLFELLEAGRALETTHDTAKMSEFNKIVTNLVDSFENPSGKRLHELVNVQHIDSLIPHVSSDTYFDLQAKLETLGKHVNLLQSTLIEKFCLPFLIRDFRQEEKVRKFIQDSIASYQAKNPEYRPPDDKQINEIVSYLVKLSKSFEPDKGSAPNTQEQVTIQQPGDKQIEEKELVSYKRLAGLANLFWGQAEEVYKDPDFLKFKVAHELLELTDELPFELTCVSLDLKKYEPKKKDLGIAISENIDLQEKFGDELKELQKRIEDLNYEGVYVSNSGAYQCLIDSMMELIKNAKSEEVGASNLTISIQINVNPETWVKEVKFIVSDNGKPFPVSFKDGVYVAPQKSIKKGQLATGADKPGIIGGANLGLSDAQKVCSNPQNGGNLYIQTGAEKPKAIIFASTIPSSDDPSAKFTIADLHSKRDTANTGLTINTPTFSLSPDASSTVSKRRLLKDKDSAPKLPELASGRGAATSHGAAPKDTNESPTEADDLGRRPPTRK